MEAGLGLAWLALACAKSLGPLVGAPLRYPWGPAAIAVEGALGILLVMGGSGAGARAAVVVPAALLMYGAVIEGWLGAPHCGCFGPIRATTGGRLAVVGVLLALGGIVLRHHERRDIAPSGGTHA